MGTSAPANAYLNSAAPTAIKGMKPVLIKGMKPLHKSVWNSTQGSNNFCVNQVWWTVSHDFSSVAVAYSVVVIRLTCAFTISHCQYNLQSTYKCVYSKAEAEADTKVKGR